MARIQTRKPKFKSGDFVEIKSGKYKGARGVTASFEPEYRNGKYYYFMHVKVIPDEEGSYINSHSIGLDVIRDVPESNLKRLRDD
jgi:hypothetical protein